MATYINKNWTVRDYECTNVVMQVCDGEPANFNGSKDTGGNWVKADDQDLATKGLDYIGGFSGHAFYGFL